MKRFRSIPWSWAQAMVMIAWVGCAPISPSQNKGGDGVSLEVGEKGSGNPSGPIIVDARLVLDNDHSQTSGGFTTLARSVNRAQRVNELSVVLDETLGLKDLNLNCLSESNYSAGKMPPCAYELPNPQRVTFHQPTIQIEIELNSEKWTAMDIISKLETVAPGRLGITAQIQLLGASKYNLILDRKELEPFRADVKRIRVLMTENASNTPIYVDN